jgi:peroxiredoxin
MTDPARLPDGLPEPEDDGACDHLVGLRLPRLTLEGVVGKRYRLDRVPTRWLVLYAYPRTGGGGVVLPDGWDMIPGARGCTPQACAFRDHRSELDSLDATVWGVSAQPIEEQREFAERMHIPFPLLNDARLDLTRPPLALPVFAVDGLTLYRRVTVIADRGTIARVFYPVFPPDRNAGEVVEYLSGRR